jgi:hypothetical protein
VASVSGTISVWPLAAIGRPRNRETSTLNSISRSVTQTGTASPRIIPKRLGGFKNPFGKECRRLFTCWVGSIDLGRVLKKMHERVPITFQSRPARPRGRHVFSVGYCLSQGEGTSPDSQKALRWYKRVASTGHKEAAYNVGNFLERGRGTKPNLASAKVWYRMSARLGDADAKRALNRLASKGHKSRR